MSPLNRAAIYLTAVFVLLLFAPLGAQALLVGAKSPHGSPGGTLEKRECIAWERDENGNMKCVRWEECGENVC
jgi:hypothetical protein